MKIKKSSPKKVPKDKILFVVETPGVNREKMRYPDVMSNLKSLDEEISLLQEKKVRLVTIKKEMDKIK
jgi:hypothetical protein|tara:strand:+ start:3025 stop:3228 length:204 start_codon:yes stop_codon:yes gene_type:complete